MDKMAKKKLHKKSKSKRNRPGRVPTLAPKNISEADLLGQIDTEPDNIRTRLALAEYYFRRGEENKIPDVLLPAKDDYPFDNDMNRGWYDRLLAFGYAGQNQLLEADEICRRGLEVDPNGLDFRFILCFITLRLREYRSAIEHGEDYLSITRQMSPDGQSSIDFTLSDSHLSQLHNICLLYTSDAADDLA